MQNYQLIRSDRRTLSLEITEDLAVLVRAPLRLPDAEIDRFVSSHESWIQKHIERRKQISEQSDPLSPEEIGKLIQLAKTVLPERVAFFAGKMGVSPAGIKITSAKTRFGSCSGRNSICFSWRLMAYPPEAVDYVVVHELAHIRHKNHGKAFYREIEKILPDYKARTKLLKHPPNG